MREKHYDWGAVQTYYDLGNSMRECQAQFGMAMSTLIKAAKRGHLRTRSHSFASKIGHTKRAPHSDETKSKLSDIAKSREFGGKNYRKTFIYGDSVLESSYELAVAVDLDFNGIRWQRCNRFYWIDAAGKKRHYTPDFFLPDYDVYLDPKNDYLILTDADKIERVSEQNNIRVIILSKSQLTWEEISKLMRT